MRGLARPYEVVEDHLERNKYFAALRKPDGTVFALVVMLKWTPNDRDGFNLTFKDMDESSGPYVYGCPLSILDKLTPTEYPHAIKWREDNRRLAENWGKVKKGAFIELPEEITFNSGRTVKLFYVESKKPFHVRLAQEVDGGVRVSCSLAKLNKGYLMDAVIRTDLQWAPQAV
jgi:hypothetical protein